MHFFIFQLNATNEKEYEREILTERNQTLEKLIRAIENESQELKEAYKEKNRKCAAWEKAYCSLREQLMASGKNDQIINSANNVNGIHNGLHNILGINNSAHVNNDACKFKLNLLKKHT